jgi:hypothetical protein
MIKVSDRRISTADRDYSHKYKRVVKDGDHIRYQLLTYQPPMLLIHEHDVGLKKQGAVRLDQVLSLWTT